MAQPTKVLVIFGTRPEAIKMAPVVKALRADPEHFRVVVCVSAQHRQMLDQVLALFAIQPDIDLDLMEENQTLEGLTVNAMRVVTETLKDVKPDVVLVQGDTTTAMVAALASFYQRIPVGHIEAGLRTGDIENPFPEEANRRIISIVATYHFAPTARAVEVLKREEIVTDRIFLTGNTVVDALQFIRTRGRDRKDWTSSLNGRRLILVTAHRRENFGQPLRNICAALKAIARANPDVEIVYPVHLNPHVKEPVHQMLSGVERIHLIEPVEYDELVALMDRAFLVLTDSGGIQEEAPVLGRPVLVMRKETERPEGVEANVVKVVGTEQAEIVRETERLLKDRSAYDRMARAISPYGDGRAAERIVAILRSPR